MYHWAGTMTEDYAMDDSGSEALGFFLYGPHIVPLSNRTLRV